MPHESSIKPLSLLEKIVVFWKQKNYDKKYYQIAQILAVSIYTNHHIYEEELERAQKILHELFCDEQIEQDLMQYIRLKLERYREDNELWLNEQQEVRDMILKNEELFVYLDEIFDADDHQDQNERLFENSIKDALINGK